MAICASGENLLQEATGIRRGRVYPVAKNVFRNFCLSFSYLSLFLKFLFQKIACYRCPKLSGVVFLNLTENF